MKCRRKLMKGLFPTLNMFMKKSTISICNNLVAKIC